MQIPDENAAFEKCQSNRWLGRKELDGVSACNPRFLWLDREEDIRCHNKTSPKRRIIHGVESPRKKVCTSPRPPESCADPDLSKLQRQASLDMESSRQKVRRTRSPSNIPTEPQPTFAMSEICNSSAAPRLKEEKKSDSPSELEFLQRPVNLIDLYHRENRIHPSWTLLEAREVPCTNLGRDDLPKDCSDEDLLYLNVALCDWGAARFGKNHTSRDISPPLYKSSEVLIGAPWTNITDSWMLGCVD